MNPDDRSTSEAKFIENRIMALSHQGSIDRLRQEARTIREAITAADNNPKFPYSWAHTQLIRAWEFDAAADRLEARREAGAAGLAS